MTGLGKRAAVLTMAGALAAMTVTGCSGSLDTEAVVATVGEEEITLGVANFYARMTQGQYETYYAAMMGTTPEDMWAQEYGEGTTMEEETKDNLLTSLEDLYILSQHASEYEISLTDDEKKAVTEAAEAFDAANTDEAKEAVSGYQKNIEKVLELMTIQTKMDAAMKEGVDEEVSDEEAAQKSMKYVYLSYTTTDESGNSTAMTDEEKADLKEKAEDLAAQVKDGAELEDAAEEAGAEVQTTTFDAESSSPSADLVAAVDALEEEGDVTDIVETDNGIYVGVLTSLLDRDATDAEKDNIVEQRRQDQYDSILEGWRDDTAIKVDEKVWSKVSFEDQGVTIITPEEDTSSDDTAADGSADSEANE